MAGTSKLIKEGQVLFRAGDKSDGMYLIRRGEVRVYLEQDGKEVQLAVIGEGGMIGEMALFDNQPRSASVKATQETEVTLISLDDFGKLMKQIPKWFVSLMSALSGRLRTTNERLKNIEKSAAPSAQPAPAAKPVAKDKPFQVVLRQLHILILIWHKDGEKDGKDWKLPRAETEQMMTEQFGEDPERVQKLLEALIKTKIFFTKQDAYKKVVLCTPNRSVLNAITLFIANYVKANPKRQTVAPELLGLVKALERLALAAPYDTSAVPLADLVKEGIRNGENTVKWDHELTAFASGSEDVKVVKTSGGLGMRTTKKEISAYVRCLEVFAELAKANLG